MKIVYLLGKISDRPRKMLKSIERFHEKEAEFRALGLEVINPARLAERSPGKSWEWYMARSMKFMVEKRPSCYFLKDWQRSTGARMEMELAKHLGLTIHVEK